MVNAPINVWTEMRATSEGISITLYSEWRERREPTQVEDEVWYTHTELEVMSEEGSLRSDLKLSESTRNRLSEVNDTDPAGSVMCSQFVEDDLPEEGDKMLDSNAPSWSSFDMVKVEEVTDKKADEYVIEENTYNPSKTVADANPSYPDDNRVVLARYGTETGWSNTAYAFPASRLE